MSSITILEGLASVVSGYIVDIYVSLASIGHTRGRTLHASHQKITESITVARDSVFFCKKMPLSPLNCFEIEKNSSGVTYIFINFPVF